LPRGLAGFLAGTAAFATRTTTVTAPLAVVASGRAVAFASTQLGAGQSSGRTSYDVDDIVGVVHVFDILQAAVAVGNREEGATRLAAMAKRFATDAGFEAVNGCLQLHGGYGYLRDHPIERVLRDVRVHQILEGTNEVMRVIIGRDLLGN